MIEQLRHLGLNLWEGAPLVMPLAVGIYGGGWWLIWKRKPAWRRPLRHVLPIGAAALVVVGGYLWWYYHRPLPKAVDRELFPGVRYVREVLTKPRALVIHMVTVDLNTPGLEFLVTPGDTSGGRELLARTTSEFLEEFEMDIAINGGFFAPWIANEPFHYYPKSGEAVDIFGEAMSQGVTYSEAEKHYLPVSITRSNEVVIGRVQENSYNVLSGGRILVTNGVAMELSYDAAHPRTAVALNRGGEQLMLVIVDGRQPNYSEGIYLEELAEILVRRGADIAINLDGGGSSTLVMRNEKGEAKVLNSPIRGRIPPGLERPSGNHLGLRIRE